MPTSIPGGANTRSILLLGEQFSDLARPLPLIVGRLGSGRARLGRIERALPQYVRLTLHSEAPLSILRQTRRSL